MQLSDNVTGNTPCCWKKACLLKRKISQWSVRPHILPRLISSRTWRRVVRKALPTFWWNRLHATAGCHVTADRLTVVGTSPSHKHTLTHTHTHYTLTPHRHTHTHSTLTYSTHTHIHSKHTPHSHTLYTHSHTHTLHTLTHKHTLTHTTLTHTQNTLTHTTLTHTHTHTRTLLSPYLPVTNNPLNLHYNRATNRRRINSEISTLPLRGMSRRVHWQRWRR
jgi:hypothetical protein